MFRRFALLLLALSAIAPGGASAQSDEGRVGVTALVRVTTDVNTENDDSDQAWERWSSRLLEAGRAEGRFMMASPAPEPGARPTGVSAERLMAFSQVEALLMEARRLAGHLDEGGALRALATALRIAESHADVPGSSRWIAEVHAALGVVAAQAGMERLMEAELASAALLDPSRGLRAAEARPSVTARAAAIAREVATRPVGRFVVRCDAPGALVFLDDRLVGPSPATVEAAVGRHVLRVEARDHLPYGAVVDLFEGRRSEVRVELARTAGASLRATLFERGAAFDLDGVVDTLSRSRAEGRPEVAWLVDVGAGPEERALLTRCDDRGCAEPLRLEGPSIGALEPAPPRPGAELLASRAVDLDWLRAGREAEGAEPAWYRRWYVWTPIAIVLVGVAAGATAAARREPADDLDITIDFGDLAR